MAIENTKKQTFTTATTEDDSWLNDPDVIASIQRGEDDIANGRGKIMTAQEVAELLGVSLRQS